MISNIKEEYFVVNGCDKNTFYPKKRKLYKKKIKLITHHFSDNYLKGQQNAL